MIVDWREVIKEDGREFYNGGWVKKIEGVDKSKSNGYAFIGEFINNSTKGLVEIDDGYYLICSIEGSRKNQVKEIAVYKVESDNIEKIIEWVKGKDWALKIRDKVANIVNKNPINSLEKYTDKQLTEELEKRGYKIERR